MCLEVLPETQWIKNYKSGQPVNILEQEAEDYIGEMNEIDEAQEESKTKKTMMERINNEKNRRVVA